MMISILCLNENLGSLAGARRAQILTGGIHGVFRGLKFATNELIGNTYGFRSGSILVHHT